MLLLGAPQPKMIEQYKNQSDFVKSSLRDT